MQGTRRIYSGLTWHVTSFPHTNDKRNAQFQPRMFLLRIKIHNIRQSSGIFILINIWIFLLFPIDAVILKSLFDSQLINYILVFTYVTSFLKNFRANDKIAK
jgi:hypothetical protein